MSEHDSFIHEVTEEVRRDKLVQTLRKNAVWIVAGLVLLIGGLSLNEYLDFSKRTAAETRGAAMQTALTLADTDASIAALETLVPEAGSAEVLARLQLAGVQAQSGDRTSAAETLEAITLSQEADPIYVDVARLKLAMVGADGVRPMDERRALLERLAVEGHPFRTIAEEQLAMIELEEGDIPAALDRLAETLERGGGSAATQARLRGLITALGGDATGAGSDLDG